MPPEVTKKLWTIEEVLRMQETGILSPDNRLELIHGELIEMSPAGKRHVAAVARLNLYLIELLGRRALVISQSSIELDAFSAPEPDVAVLRFRDDFYAENPIRPEDFILLSKWPIPHWVSTTRPKDNCMPNSASPNTGL